MAFKIPQLYLQVQSPGHLPLLPPLAETRQHPEGEGDPACTVGTLSPGEVLMLPQGTEDWKLKPCAHAFGVLLAPECASCHCSQM